MLVELLFIVVSGLILISIGFAIFSDDDGTSRDMIDDFFEEDWK